LIAGGSFFYNSSFRGFVLPQKEIPAKKKKGKHFTLIAFKLSKCLLLERGGGCVGFLMFPAGKTNAKN